MRAFSWTSEGLEHEESHLTVVPDPEWKVISTGLEASSDEGEGAESFLVPNFDVLVDSPIEVGNQQVHSFDVNGIRHEVSIFSQERILSNKVCLGFEKNRRDHRSCLCANTLRQISISRRLFRRQLWRVGTFEQHALHSPDL